MEECNGKAEEQSREKRKIEWERWREADLAAIWFFLVLGRFNFPFLYGGSMQSQ